MRRPIVIAAGLLVAALIVAGGALSVWPAEPMGPVYTVAEVTTGLRQHPGQWVGRTVAVRGVTLAWYAPYKIGPTGAGQAPASSWWSLVIDPAPPIGRRISRATAVGRVQFNAPGTAPTLLLQGGPPAPTLLDRAQRFVAQLAAHRDPARRTTTYDFGPPQPRVYRVQFLAPARCPASLASPCYSAVVR